MAIRKCSSLSALFWWLTLSSLSSLSSAADCDTSNPPSTNRYYKAFCGRTYVVGFPDTFSPYSWYVGPSEEESETLRYITSISAYNTLDGWIGLDPDIMDEIAEFLGFNYTVVDVRLPGTNDTWTSILIEYMAQVDIMGNNFALSAEREDVGFFSEKQVDMSAFLVQISSYESSTYTWHDAFKFVTPFSSGVWLAAGVCMVVSALVVYILDWSFYVERRVEKRHGGLDTSKQNDKESNNDKDKDIMQNFERIDIKKKPSDQKKKTCQEYWNCFSLPDCLTNNISNDYGDKDDDDDEGIEMKPISLFDSFYLAFASFTGAEQFAPVSRPSKIFVASWSVLVLLLLSTYTANLAATLTKNNSFVEEIQSVDDAISLGVKTCVSTRSVYYPSLPTSYSTTDELSQLYPFLEVNGLWTDLFEYMKNGTCRVALFNREDITAALQDQDYCDLLVVGGMSDSDGNGYADSEMLYFSTGLVMNSNDTDLYSGVNAALQYLQRSGIAQSLRSSWAGGVCTLDSVEEDSDVTSIQLKHLIGPFAVHFTVGCAIILYAIARHIVIYYNIDLIYFKRDLTIHAEPFEDDLDEENEDKFDNDENNELLMTRKCLFEINQRMMFIENEFKNKQNRQNISSGDTVTSLGHENSMSENNGNKGKLSAMGESTISDLSGNEPVHVFNNSDLDMLGGVNRSTRGGGMGGTRQQRQQSRYDHRILSEQSGGGFGGAGNASMRLSAKQRTNRGRNKKRFRHVPSVHVMR